MRRKKVVVSAPGKVHFMGEHAVVYGRPALLGAIDKRCRVTVEEASHELRVVCEGSNSLVKSAVAQVKDYFNLKKLPHMALTVSSEIPQGCGLGSSAAVAVATIGGLLAFLDKKWELDNINELAYEVEKIQHGTPSGADNLVSTLGGLVWFRKELDFLKLTHPLPVSVSSTLAPFVLVDTGKPFETTSQMVKLVRRKVGRSKSKIQELFGGIEEQVRRMAEALLEGKDEQVIDTIHKGEKLLEKLGVVSTPAKKVVRKIEEVGGAAKITGAGGKKSAAGMLLVYHKQPNKVAQLTEQMGLPIYRFSVDQDGVRYES